MHIEQVSLADLAGHYGTPAYVYSRTSIERQWRAFDNALGGGAHRVCYAVKANSNLAILNLLARLGSGFDIVSVGELERVLAAKGDPAKIVFSGVGKRVDEIERALEVGIHCFNIESEAEIDRINVIAKAHGCQAPVAIRINPDIDGDTHPYISTGLQDSKFGIAMDRALSSYQRATSLSGIKTIGLACHIGSQITDLTPFVDALDRLLEFAKRLQATGLDLKHLDLGGGLGICYQDETPPQPDEYIGVLLDHLQDTGYQIILEPGRAIVGNAGVLLTCVEYLKPGLGKNFAIVDAGMNDLMRPALYQAWHTIEPVENKNRPLATWDVVGPVCESGDFLGKARPLAIAGGDWLCVGSAGAYGFSMSSQYNTRARAIELMVDNKQTRIIRERESIPSLYQNEHLLP